MSKEDGLNMLDNVPVDFSLNRELSQFAGGGHGNIHLLDQKAYVQ